MMGTVINKPEEILCNNSLTILKSRRKQCYQEKYSVNKDRYLLLSNNCVLPIHSSIWHYMAYVNGLLYLGTA